MTVVPTAGDSEESNGSVTSRIVRERMGVYEGKMVRKRESRLSPIGGPGHGIL